MAVYDTYFGDTTIRIPSTSSAVSTSALQREQIARRQAQLAAANKPKTTKPPTSPGAAPAYYGSGGGGGGAPDPNKPYLNYYTRFLNISPNKALVSKAAAGNYTMAEFALLVQREDTKRWLTTWKGQEVAENFRTMWARIFPSLGSQPGIKALSKFLKQEPSKSYRDITNPTSVRAMYAYLSGTKLFRQIYPEFERTRFAQRLDFAGYRQEKDQFRNIMRQYTGRLADETEISYFFRSRITSGDFEKNLQTMLAGEPAYQYATGETLGEETKQKALYGRKGSAQTLAKIADAYQRHEKFQKSGLADYLTQQQSGTGRITTRYAY